jgi:hypothetical protein
MSIQKNLVARRAVLLSMIVASSAFSADIRYISGQGDQRVSDHEHVIITGEIVGGDTDKLRKALTQLTPDPSHRVNPIVILDSPGGNVPVALEMGRSLRESSAWTIVDRGGSCSSSCVFLIAGGVRRSVFSNGRIGLHRPRFDYQPFASLSKDQAREAYSSLVGACVNFMKEMGISDQVFSDMLRVPSQEIKFVSRSYAEKYGLVGDDPAWEEWRRARDVQEHGEARIKAQDRLIECYNSGTDTKQCDERYERDLREINKQGVNK